MKSRASEFIREIRPTYSCILYDFISVDRSNYFPQLELPKKVGPSQPEVGPSHSHPSLSAYTRARGMDHSAPITLNANQGTRRAIKRCPPMRAVAKPSKPKLAPRSQKWPLGHRRGTMPRCATATVPTASHTSQVPISTTHDANSASAALHESPCAALRPRSSLSVYLSIYLSIY